jgi:oligogalacturonide lyase
MPAAWIDEDTGHRIQRLVNDDGEHRSFYFHNHPFIQAQNGKEDLMVYFGSTDEDRQLFTVNLQTGETQQVTTHPGRKHGEILANKRREVFYQVNDTIFATHIDHRTTRKVFVFPDDFKANITTLNADETKLAGTWASPKKREIYENNPAKSDYFDLTFDAKIPHTLFTIDLKTGEIDRIHSENTWLGHIQFSPTDPNLLMFCHEGPWHKVDRIWNLDLRTNEVQKIHERTVYREIAGHEFFGPEGKTIWYDLQIPRGETFYLAGYRVKNGKQVRYQMDRDQWSIHFNVSPDQKLFCGDGGDSTQVAHAEHGRWIYLFRPKGGRLKAEKLVNMDRHHYRNLEPNVHFSPDGQQVIFRANFEGKSQIYAVDIDP